MGAESFSSSGRKEEFEYYGQSFFALGNDSFKFQKLLGCRVIMFVLAPT